jgi:hypothetical protein
LRFSEPRPCLTRTASPSSIKSVPPEILFEPKLPGWCNLKEEEEEEEEEELGGQIKS